MLKMNQPTISFISSSTEKTDEMVIENDEPEEMEKLEYSESDDEEASGDAKNIDSSSVENLSTFITNSSNTALENNVGQIVDPKTISVLDRLEEHIKNPEDILELDEKLDPSPNGNNNNVLLELATQKGNIILEDECLEQKNNKDGDIPCDLARNEKMIIAPEVENINSEKCISPSSHLIIETQNDDDKMMVVELPSDDLQVSLNVESKETIDDVDIALENSKDTEVKNDDTLHDTDEENIFLQSTQTFSLLEPQNVKSKESIDEDDKALEKTKITDVGDDTSQNTEEENVFLQTTQVFPLTSDEDSKSRQNNDEDDEKDLDETERFPLDDDVVDDDDNDSLLDEIDEAISNSEGGNTNSMIQSDTQMSIADDDDSKSKSDNEVANLEADDSFGNLMIDESNTEDREISNEKIETETLNSDKKLECDKKLSEVVTTNVEVIKGTSEANNAQPSDELDVDHMDVIPSDELDVDHMDVIQSDELDDDQMDVITETDLRSNDKITDKNIEEPAVLEIDAIEDAVGKESEVAAPLETTADSPKESLIIEAETEVVQAFEIAKAISTEITSDKPKEMMPTFQITNVISESNGMQEVSDNDESTEGLTLNGDSEVNCEADGIEKVLTETSEMPDVVGKPLEGIRIKGVSELNDEATQIAKEISEAVDDVSSVVSNANEEDLQMKDLPELDEKCVTENTAIDTMEIEEPLDKSQNIDDLVGLTENLGKLNEINLAEGDQDVTVVADKVDEIETSTNNELEESNALVQSTEIESSATELDSKTGNRKRLLSSEISSDTEDSIKKPRIDLNLPFDDIELIEKSGVEIETPKIAEDSTGDAKPNGIEEDVEMQELPEEKDEDFVEDNDDDDDDDDTDDDKPLSSIKSPHSQRASIDSIEEGEDNKNKFSEISKNIDEASADIPDEPAIKSVPKSLPFLKKFKRELTNFTTEELEELVLQKIVEALVCKSHISQLQEKVDKQEEVINSVRSKFNELSKLYKDLEMVHLRVLRDMDIKNEGYIVPVRITRAVGLQVTQDPKGKFTQTETTVKNLIEKNTRIIYKPIETKMVSIPPTASQASTTTSTTSNSATNTTQNGGEIKKPRTVQKFTPMRPQLTPAQQLQIQKQTQQEKQLLLQQQKQKILLQKQQQQQLPQQQQQQQQQPTQHQQTIQQKIAQSQQNIQRQQAAMQAQQQRSPPQTASISLKNGQMIVSRPVNGLSVTTTTPSSLIIKKATVPNRVVLTQSSPSTTNTVTTQTFPVVSSTTTTTTAAPASTPPKSVIDLTDEEDVKVSESQSPGKMNILNGQPPALVAIPGQKGVNKLTYVIRNPSNNNKILVQNIPQLQQNRVTLQKVPGTPNRYGMTKSEVNRLYYLTHRTRLLMRRKERHTRNKHIWNHLTQEFTIAPKHVNGKPVLPQQLQSTPTTPPVTPSISERTALATTINIQRSITHPAPLPNPPLQESDPSWKRIPPRPIVRIQNSNSGIVISWSLDSTRGGYATIESYQIYAYQETPSPPATDSWRHVGDVKSMLLPMAVTLTHFEEGRRYYFAVRAVDEHNRVGVFSLPKTW